ncbi:MAG TPA: ribonuclease domain-containing protein [Stenotrophomonas sp.]
MRKPALLVLALALLIAGLWAMRTVQQPHPQFAPSLQAPAGQVPVTPAVRPTKTPGDLPPFLPPEARTTIALIQRGGPFPHRQDGSVFGNREGHLPDRPRGYYREYTVDTPGLSHRGTRRIVTGGEPIEIWYFSDDHYESFRSFSVPAQVAP